jgi:S-adenosylmethionine decarboxylase
MNNRGLHATLDLYMAESVSDAAMIQYCNDAILKSKMTIVACTIKQFEPHGVTVVWILSESHFTLHTYPEHKYASVDCYTCGNEGSPGDAVDRLIELLQPRHAVKNLFARGKPIPGTEGSDA